MLIGADWWEWIYVSVGLGLASFSQLEFFTWLRLILGSTDLVDGFKLSLIRTGLTVSDTFIHCTKLS